MTDRPIRSFSITERRVLLAKEQFDATLRNQPEMSRAEQLVRWRTFLECFDADLKALSWRRVESL